ncbi:NADPH2:quinone reductase [Pseudomonas sp. NFACC02]|uniref:NADPH:quinone reductase n=1 Tax=Pseudomonas sp. NFACC02 TaxID=1566250 RepID=UPI0008BF639C|nr:NADPH:quinone reductase [Pseudomonas sp. NFACC02]SER73486.1 NADPH2:quinone reductase [Pseudomonas sp. NFACC02]
MKAAYYDRLGPAAEVLRVGELDTPSPGPGEVRVRVAVSGLNPSDIKGRSGFKGAMPYDRIIPHQDGAGVVDAVGEGVSRTRIGERVWVFEAQTGKAFGTAAEYVVVPTDRAIPLADEVSFEQGASLGVAALTAHRCLFADGALSGCRVLVHGGAGVVGYSAIQLAKWAGAWVVTTIRHEQDRETAERSGADLVVNLREEDLPSRLMAATANVGVDRIVDVDLRSNLELDMACLAQGGTVSAYSVETPDATLSIPVLKAMVKGWSFRFVLVYTMPDEAKRSAIRDITRCLAAGGYKAFVGQVFALEDVDLAHDALEARRVKGHMLIRVGSV